MNLVLNQLNAIAALQLQNDLYYANGLFACKRCWAGGLYQRQDSTAFFTACIGFTLKRYEGHFTSEEKLIARGIIEKMHKSFELYRNKDGHASYNFWKTNPSQHFPGGHFAHRFKFFMIPDDIDDSAMIHLVKQHIKEEQLALKLKMKNYAIGILKWADKPVRGYEHFKAYNTFFVKNMPSAFDICALCNALYFIYYYQLPINEQDEQSLNLIAACLNNNDHLVRPYEMSPYYPNSVLIIYHMVRLMEDMKVSVLFQFRERLIAQARALLSVGTTSKMDQVVLGICLQKMGIKDVAVSEPNRHQKAQYPFFVAGILGEVKPKWLRSLSFSNATHIKYTCSAYAETLWLEHLLLNRAAEHAISNS
jgi:hypothetical protein